MTRQLKIFWTGMLIYLVSFFLVAIRNLDHQSTPLYGFMCAYGAFFYPITVIRFSEGSGPGAFVLFSLLVAGLINPVFILTAFLHLTGQYPRAFALLRIVVLLMFPFCWYLFLLARIFPREGHFLWIIGILLALCSHWLAKAWDALPSRR